MQITTQNATTPSVYDVEGTSMPDGARLVGSLVTVADNSTQRVDAASSRGSAGSGSSQKRAAFF